MEIVGEGDGATTALQNGREAVFGRGFGFNTNDRTVSRRHLAFEVHAEASQTEPRVSFEVLGKNPIWIWSKSVGKVRVFRRLEKGELVAGDCFCVSGKRPNWFFLRKFGVEEERKSGLEDESELAESLQSGFAVEDVDVSGIDPVKEFGFVVMGHEFEVYPKHKIRDVKSWDWFIEEPMKESDDDEFEKKVRGVKRKRRKGEEIDDDDYDEWTGEIEDEEELAVNMRKVSRPKYSTRSRDHSDKPQKDRKSSENSMQKKTYDDDADEDEETLGGFVVGDDDADQEEEEEEEEEEEFVEDDELDD
ncbi:hypothetical protein FNV43_RR06681 [Rhamnella rubrinervis]|uniref:FHA domain-containing protein n=1 Tax=Rhamnella rubrinervis TaxID=2594499 RepID=A0A8K0MLN8_9ROSA|nr:hypothetical protein FNV43_RR06681 [Rhamnella rubrinervis]